MDTTTLKEITLPSGKVATINNFQGKHIRKATQKMGDDTSMFLFALMSECVLIDGAPVVMEDFDNMNGKDVLKLQAEFSGINF